MRYEVRNLWKPVLAAALAAAGVSLLGGAATDLGPWYAQLEKPAWQPPDWLFGPAWTFIFAIIALAGVMAWRSTGRSFQRSRYIQRRRLIGLFGLNALLNVGWSLLFFRLERPDWALAEVLLLWLSIVWLIVFLFPLSRLASGLLLPYLAWVTFAAVLNLSVVQLNAPFEGV